MLQPFFGKQMVSIEVSTIFWEKWSNSLLFFASIGSKSQDVQNLHQHQFRGVVLETLCLRASPQKSHRGDYGTMDNEEAHNLPWQNSGCICSKMPHDEKIITWRTKCVQTLIDDIDEQNGTKYAFRLKDVPFLLTWGFHFGFLFKDYERLKGARAQTIT
jgi:hypothetical protein